MYAVVLMLLAQTPPNVVEDIDSLLPSLHSLRAFPWAHRDAVEQEQRHSQHMDWLTRLEESRTVHRDIVHSYGARTRSFGWRAGQTCSARRTPEGARGHGGRRWRGCVTY